VLNRKPVAYLVCNQSPPGADGTPSLMTFRDVETLFHEVSKFLLVKKLKIFFKFITVSQILLRNHGLTVINQPVTLQRTAKVVGK